MDFTHHFSKLHSLLRIEREEDRKQYLQKIQNRSVQDRKKEGVCWHPVVINKSYLGLGEKWVFEVERTQGLGERHLFQSGASVSVFLAADKEYAVSGIIHKIYENRMTIILNRDDPPDWIGDGKIGVNLLFDESTYDEMERTLGKLMRTHDERLKQLISIILGGQVPETHKTIGRYNNPLLNETQNEAIKNIQSAKDIALVHGPPGTGKTTTLVDAIIECIATEKQVLICAPSNAAVDLLVEKLHNSGVDVVRLGHPARVTEEVMVHTLDVQLTEHPDAKLLKDLRRKAEELRRIGTQYKRNFGRAEAAQRKLLIAESKQIKDEAHLLEGHMLFDILNRASVIACTLVGAANSLLHNRKFQTVFIDECSQAIEPANWIPIMKAQRIVMAGDHLQLPPTVKSREAATQGLATTLFERCMDRKYSSTMLGIQYRMHPDIMSFSNRRFYHNQLQCAPEIHQRRPLFARAALFIDTAGCGFNDELNAETLSTFNVDEARFCLQHLNQTIHENFSDNYNPTIGIIAPYKAQVEQLNTQWRDFEWKEGLEKYKTIHTVDAFQGQERDIIYISLTRSNSSGEIGFLADERRMNVAMTRARHLLVLVGDSATLCRNGFFDDMVQHFQSAGGYHSAFEFQID